MGGVATLNNEFPWQVGITSRRGKPYCGGSLINNRYVLTAAHCVNKREPSQIHILIGGHDWTDHSVIDKLVLAKSVIVHPNYKQEGFVNDIALIKMTEDIIFNENAKPACFPRPGRDYHHKMAIVTGWGRTTEGGEVSETLLKVELPILPIKTCKSAYGRNLIHSSVFCAGWMEGKKDSCEGDSGGPLVWQENQRWYLIGLVSWGYGCARPFYPAIYTRVDYYYNWIDSQTIGSKFCTTT